MNKEDILEAYRHLRKTDSVIPDEVLDFMKDLSIEKLEKTLPCKIDILKNIRESYRSNIRFTRTTEELNMLFIKLNEIDKIINILK